MLQESIARIKQTVKARYWPEIVRSVKNDELTYLDGDALTDIHRRVRQIEGQFGDEGILIEAGCALGGSAIVIADAKESARPFYVYDVFGMIPPPSDMDDADVQERYSIIASGQSPGLGKNKYYGYEENLLEKVARNFDAYDLPLRENNIHFVKGLFQDTMRINAPVALAHIDGDWYDSVMTCLTRIEPHLMRGGVLVIDDYDAWSGCRKAVDQYFADKASQYNFVREARLHIVRK